MPTRKVAVLATVYFPGSHADVLATRLIEGYKWDGRHTSPRVEVASLYLEQLGSRDDEPGSLVDIGLEIARRNGVPVFATVGEALGLGKPGLAVDGVVIIGEHGDFELNEYGQKLYPRRRLFDAAVASMVTAGRVIPVFNDKHLAHSLVDARHMVGTAGRLGFPLMAGSTLPLTWRSPADAEWPLDARMTDAVSVAQGPLEMYGFHNLEALQVHAERRTGGETGVVAVQALTGLAARKAIEDGAVDADLFRNALEAMDLSDADRTLLARSVRDVFLVEYADSLRAAVVNFEEVVANRDLFAVACRGPLHAMACQMWVPGHPHPHFIFLARQIESMMLTRTAPWPVERTLLTTGVLDLAMQSLHLGEQRLTTSALDVRYQPATDVPDTGVGSPLPINEKQLDPSHPTGGALHV